MKTFLSFSIICLFTVGGSAQVLFGTFRNAGVENSVRLDVSSQTFSIVNTLNTTKGIGQGMTSFDPLNGRYFNITEDEIKIIDVQTGSVIDSVINAPRLYNIEFDQANNRLIGTRWNGTVMLFSELDLATKVFTDIDTLTNTFGVVQGETAFDGATNRYFNIMDWRITIINAQTGVVIDSINNFSTRMKGIQFNPVTNELVGTRWNGSYEEFTKLDLSTNTFTSFGNLTGVEGIVQGESAFDIINNRYFNKTNLGITIIDAANGTIIDTIANNIQMKGIELDSEVQSAIVGPQLTLTGIQVYPNPATTSEVTVTTAVKESNPLLLITDLSGGKMYFMEMDASKKINIEHLPSGCYVIRDSAGNSKILVKP